MEEHRTPVGRSDFKSGERRQTSLVGSTPTLFRQIISPGPSPSGGRLHAAASIQDCDP